MPRCAALMRSNNSVRRTALRAGADAGRVAVRRAMAPGGRVAGRKGAKLRYVESCWGGRVTGSVALLACTLAVGQAAAQAFTRSPSGSPCQVVHGWPLLPQGELLGEVSGVGVDSHDNVFVFHRAGREWPDIDVLELTPIVCATQNRPLAGMRPNPRLARILPARWGPAASVDGGT